MDILYLVSHNYLPCFLPEYDRLIELAEQLRNSPYATMDSLGAIFRVFQILVQYASPDVSLQSQIPLGDDTLREIISWTEQHYTEKISLDEIAQKVGYGKSYFCNKFKATTGQTYLNYLNNLRICHACELLKEGRSISQACDACGFENMSYFIQLFKKIVGTTPKKYIYEVQNNEKM